MTEKNNRNALSYLNSFNYTEKDNNNTCFLIPVLR